MDTLTPSVVTDTDSSTQTEKDKCAHIVKTEKNQTATALVLQARIEGTPIEALCGHKWVPSRNPENLPVCQTCKEIYEIYKLANELNDIPQV